MKRILLMGNPNVGKSVLFNRLTGVDVVQSNYPGTTVDYTRGYMSLKDEDIEVIDVPGTFSLEPKDRAEEVAVKMLEENRDSVIVCVFDSTKIDRGLYLALEIIERDYPVVIVLNMWDDTLVKNIHINMKKLESILGVPVVATVAIAGEGIKEFVSRIEDASRIKIEDIMKRVSYHDTDE